MNTLPEALRQTPDLDRWVQIDSDETITIFTGKVEIGQGIRTTLAQIAAEELDVAVERIRVVMADTARTPDEGHTAGSNSTQGSGGAIRQAAAEVRHLLITAAATRWAVPAEHLHVRDGVIIDPVSENSLSYWELQGGQPLRQQAYGVIRPKPVEQYTVVGTSVARLDLPAKVRGEPVFVADMTLPGMVHGRVVRPSAPGATLLGVDVETVRQMAGVLAVVHNGSFLGVVAVREFQAVRAAEALAAAAEWREPTPLPAEETIFATLRSAPSQDFLVVDGTPVATPVPPIAPPAAAEITHSATYLRPYTMHAALGPSAALAHQQGAHLTIWTHSQGVFPLRASLADVLGMDETNLRLIHVEGPGCYGHNGADDVTLDAALLAQAVPDYPVLVQWSRADEHRWEPYGTPAVIEMNASLDAAGAVIDWNHDVWSYTHSGRPRPMTAATNLLAAWHLAAPVPAPAARPGLGRHNGIHRNADPLYAFPQRRIVKHFVADSPLRTSSLRGLGAFANVFAIESFMDELALHAGADPVAFRLRHLADPRAEAVITQAATLADWSAPRRPDYGRGIGFAQYKNEKAYAAVIVDLHVERATGDVYLDHLTIAADAGRIINPDGLCNQLEGGAIQAASWTLKEAVRFGPTGLQSVDWESYPVLRLHEAPTVKVTLLEPPAAPPLGAGEATQGPTAAAIANAIFDAVGVRLRQLPLTPARLLSALAIA